MWGSFKTFIIRQCDGYVTVDEALDAIETASERRHILTRAAKRLFNTIGTEDILQVNEFDQWIFQGKPMNEAEKNLLVSQAHGFYETKLWEILKADIKYQANRKMFILGGDDLQISAGKLWLLTLEAMDQRLKNMKEKKGQFSIK